MIINCSKKYTFAVIYGAIVKKIFFKITLKMLSLIKFLLSTDVGLL